MKNSIYILLILLFSCDDLQEHSADLPYEFSILEGWAHFVDGNYEMAEELFSEVLNIDPSLVPYFSEAYLGLAWSEIYHAKVLTGNENFFERQTLRNDANDKLILALEEISSYDGADQMPDNLLLDLYAALAFVNSSLVLYEEYYENPSDDLVNSALEFSDSLLSLNPEYFFLYDSTNINSNSVHLLRAQLFLEINEFESAQDEISQVNFNNTEISFNLDYNHSEMYDMYLHVGFKDHEKHLFKMNYNSLDSSYSISRSFTPFLPCVDLIIDDIDISNNEIVECLSSFPTNILEYTFSIQVPNTINEEYDNVDCELEHLEWIDGMGCVDGYIYMLEDLNDGDCISDGYRTIEISNNDSLITVTSCYNSCDSCSE